MFWLAWESRSKGQDELSFAVAFNFSHQEPELALAEIARLLE